MTLGSPTDKGFGQGSSELARWAEGVYAPEDEVLREIRERSLREGLPGIQVGTFDGLHLEVLARAIGARKAVEIGTLGGYSGVCILRGLAAGGTLDTFELEEKHARVARTSFARAGFTDRARIHIGKASEKLAEIEGDGPFDLVFIDADKTGYPGYLSWAERNLRTGGIVLGDNAFGFGGVARDDVATEDMAAVMALRLFSERLAHGGRFRSTMLPTAEGLAMGVKVR